MLCKCCSDSLTRSPHRRGIHRSLGAIVDDRLRRCGQGRQGTKGSAWVGPIENAEATVVIRMHEGYRVGGLSIEVAWLGGES